MAKKQTRTKAQPAKSKTKVKAKVKAKTASKSPVRKSVMKAVQKAIASSPPQPYLTYKIDLVRGDVPSYRLADDAIEVINSRGEALEKFISLSAYLNNRGLDGWRLYGFFDLELEPILDQPTGATRLIFFKEMIKPVRPASD